VSCSNPTVTYIGETGNLPERIDAHNSGYGSHQTQSRYLRPWAVLAYVVGFGGNVKMRKAFKSQWKNLKQYEEQSKSRQLHPEEVVDLGRRVIATRKMQDNDECLRLVKAGTVVS